MGRLNSKDFFLPRCFINGFNTSLIRLELPQQQTFFGVRLQPLSVKKVLGIPANEFSDIVLDLALVNVSFCMLWEQLAECKSFKRRVDIFSQWVSNKASNYDPREKLINHFLIATGMHDYTISQLSRLLCYSPRQLSRKFRESTGLNAEEILLYKKYLHSVHLIHATGMSLTEIAYQSCFADQSHFIKTFKKFTEMTPGAYRGNKGFLQGHIFENVR